MVGFEELFEENGPTSAWGVERQTRPRGSEQAPELITRCGFFGPNNVRVREAGLRNAVVAATQAEWAAWHQAGRPVRENDAAMFGALVRYYLSSIRTIRPDTLSALQANARTVNYRRLTSAAATRAQLDADIRTHVRPDLLRRVPGATVPTNLDALIDAKLNSAIQANRDNDAWSAVWVTAVVRGVAIASGLETMVGTRISGHDLLLRASVAHRRYALEAHRRRQAGRHGAYWAFDPARRVPRVGDIIVQDRTARRPADVITFAGIDAFARGRGTHGDIVTLVADDHVVAVGGNLGGSVRKRRYPTDAQRRLVRDTPQLYTQENARGVLPALPDRSNAVLHTRSTARITTLLSPVELCAAVPGQRYRGGILT